MQKQRQLMMKGRCNDTSLAEDHGLIRDVVKDLA